VGLYNPFTFARKVRTATNALLASYTLLQLTGVNQRVVLSAAQNVAPHWFAEGWEDKLADLHNRIIFLNLVAIGLMECNIPPSLPGELWFHVRNPFVESIGAEQLISQIQTQLEAKYGVRIDIGDEDN
jgi:hypothetical protein